MLGRHFHANMFSELLTTDLTCAQIYTHGPRNSNENSFDAAMVKKSARRIPIYSHSTYVSHPWKGVKNHDHVRDQLESCRKLGLRGLVVHLPKDQPMVVADTMELLNDEIPILLEMTSVAPHPTKTYETPQKIDDLVDILNDYSINFGIVIDTSHIWAAGVDVRSYTGVKKWLTSIVNKDAIKMFHLNGTSVPLGGHRDIHIIPFAPEDLIWGSPRIPYERSGVRAITEFSRANGLPMIMEVNRGSEVDFEYAKNTIQPHIMV